MWEWGAVSAPVRVEARPLAGAIDLQRALLTDRVGTLENPVLPRGQAREDPRVKGFSTIEAQIGFHPGQRIGTHRDTLLDGDACFVVPIDIVRVAGDQPGVQRR